MMSLASTMTSLRRSVAQQRITGRTRRCLHTMAGSRMHPALCDMGDPGHVAPAFHPLCLTRRFRAQPVIDGDSKKPLRRDQVRPYRKHGKQCHGIAAARNRDGNLSGIGKGQMREGLHAIGGWPCGLRPGPRAPAHHAQQPASFCS